MKKSPKVKISPKKLALLVMVILLIVAAVSAIIFVIDYQKKKNLANNPQIAKEQETTEIVAKVGRLIKLPNETPSIATVSDITKLSDQTLFQNAQNGDKVLIFNQAKRAIVYRPSENVIVEVGNVVVSPESSASADTQDTEKVKIVLLNATSTAGYARKVGADLVGKYPNIEVASTGNAVDEYAKNTVYVIKGSNANDELAKNIASAIDGEVEEDIPSDEEKPSDADILIILGK